MAKKEKKKNLIEAINVFLRNFKWADIFGMSVFLFILGIAFFFFLRKGNYVDIVLRVSESQELPVWAGKTPVWYIENLKPGVIQKDLVGRPVISIISTKSFRTSEQNKIFYVNLRLRAVYTPRTNEYVFNGVPILIGSFQTFSLNGVKVMGVVQKIKNIKNEYPRKKLLVKGWIDPVFNGDLTALAANTVSDGISKDLSLAFNEGMVIKDNDNNVILKIRSVERMPATKQFIYGNSVIKTMDYDRDKVQMELEISVDEINQTYIFMDENLIKINSTIYIDFFQFGANFKITSIEEIK